jgi:hypothetical protein
MVNRRFYGVGGSLVELHTMTGIGQLRARDDKTGAIIEYVHGQISPSTVIFYALFYVLPLSLPSHCFLSIQKLRRQMFWCRKYATSRLASQLLFHLPEGEMCSRLTSGDKPLP